MTNEIVRNEITSFTFEGDVHEVEFQRVEIVGGAIGVICSEYKVLGFEGEMDLGVIDMVGNTKTPAQVVMKGNRTVEVYGDGSGRLEITRLDQTKEVHEVTPGTELAVDVNVGDMMQWIAGEDGLRFYEVCYPPFETDRFWAVEDI